jgi:hypothetical protein
MDRDQQLLTALTTEHFTLQGARSQTMTEISARGSLYVFSVSSALIALGFISQVSDVGDLFNTFALTVLPTLYALGAVTFVRMVECAAEDFRYGMAINRIRGYYQELAGDRADLFLLSGRDDPGAVRENMINGVVGGAAVALALGALADASLTLAAVVGGVAAIVSVVLWLRVSDTLFMARAAEVRPLFPPRT